MLLQSSSGKSQAPENNPRRTHLSIRSKARSSTGGEKPQPEPVTHPAELSLRLGAKRSFQPWLHMRITQKFFKIPMPGLHLKPIKQKYLGVEPGPWYSLQALWMVLLWLTSTALVILCNGTGTTDRALRTSRLRRAPQFAMCFFPASELGCDGLHDQPRRSLLSPVLQRGRLRLRGSTRLPNVTQRASGREATESGFSDSRT